MATAGYTRPQNYSSVHDDEDDEALDIHIDSKKSQPTGDNAVTSLHGQVQEVVGVMKQNIDKLLDRDVALNNLVDRADNLQSSAITYNQTTKQLRRKFWWKNVKTNVCIGAIVIAVVLIIIMSVTLSRRTKN